MGTLLLVFYINKVSCIILYYYYIRDSDFIYVHSIPSLFLLPPPSYVDVLLTLGIPKSVHVVLKEGHPTSPEEDSDGHPGGGVLGEVGGCRDLIRLRSEFRNAVIILLQVGGCRRGSGRLIQHKYYVLIKKVHGVDIRQFARNSKSYIRVLRYISNLLHIYMPVLFSFVRSSNSSFIDRRNIFAVICIHI